MHNTVLEVAVIADDLTGAADTGVQFCPYFTNTVLVSYRDLSPDSFGLSPQVLSVYTNSRSMNPELARDRVGHVAGQLSAFQPGHMYKKVDSCLRGNLGAEVDAILDEVGFECSFIAPAFPDMGRTTFHDIHQVDGTPVSETELSKDPVTPVTESRLSRIVGGQSRYKVGHVDVSVLDSGDEVLLREIERLVQSGARHLVFDAEKRGRSESAGKSRHGVGGEASTETCRRAHVESLSRSQVHYRVRSSPRTLAPSPVCRQAAMRRRPVMVRLRRISRGMYPDESGSSTGAV